MILLATNERDLTSDYIVLELAARGVAFHRLNIATVTEASGRFGVAPDRGWTLRTSSWTLSLAEVGAGYFRRPGALAADPAVSDADVREYCEVEWSALLKSVYRTSATGG